MRAVMLNYFPSLQAGGKDSQDMLPWVSTGKNCWYKAFSAFHAGSLNEEPTNLDGKQFDPPKIVQPRGWCLKMPAEMRGV